MSPILEARELACVRQQKALFQNLNFVLRESAVLLVEGPNGSGKSSLLRLLTGLCTPARGEVCWGGQPIQILKQEYWLGLHYCGHSNGIKAGLTLTENLQLAMYLGQSTPSEINSALQELHLLPYLHTYAGHLSAGQKRRAALARIFIYPKKLWILDEPLTALDTAGQDFFLRQLQKHREAGGMAVISSHHPLVLKQDCMRVVL